MEKYRLNAKHTESLFPHIFIQPVFGIESKFECRKIRNFPDGNGLLAVFSPLNEGGCLNLKIGNPKF